MYKIVGNEIISYNPATKEEIGKVRISTRDDINTIVDRSRKAFLVWKGMSFTERGSYLLKLADYLDRNKELFADLMTKEMGRPLTESIPEVIKSARFLRYFALNSEKLLENEAITEVAGKEVHLVFEPYGVAALIKPWNMPLQTPIWALAPALMAGNGIVLKPSENTLLTAQMLEEAINEVGFPKGLIGVVYGEKEQGKQLLDCNIDMVSFTGSVAAGQQIAEQVASRFVKTSLELGGKDPMIVFDDVNVDFAAMAAVWGSTTNCGQFCSSIERVYVHENIYNQFVEKCAQICESIKVGNGLDSSVEMGPVVNEQQFNKIIMQIQDAVAHGAKIITGGGTYQNDKRENGYFIQPTVIVNLTNDMLIMQEETFGPLVRIMKFKDEEDAIKLANDSKYGLGSSIVTQDKKRADRIAHKIETGMVWINEPLLSHEKCPWIPRKNSGLGFELGTLGLKEFVRTKIISAQFENNNVMRSWWYPYNK